MQTAAPFAWASVAVDRVPSDLSRRLASGHHADTVRSFVFARRTFLAGERVDMNELAAQLGVTESAVRNALTVLEVLGMVEVRSGSGTYVVDAGASHGTCPVCGAVSAQDGRRHAG